MSTIPATVRVEATLSVPNGYGWHDERHVVYCCAQCATYLLTRQYVPVWDWNAMAPTTTYGTYGSCAQCEETTARQGQGGRTMTGLFVEARSYSLDVEDDRCDTSLLAECLAHLRIMGETERTHVVARLNEGTPIHWTEES